MGSFALESIKSLSAWGRVHSVRLSSHFHGKNKVICRYTLPLLILWNWWIFSPLAECYILVLGWDYFMNIFFGLMFWQVHSVYLVTNVGCINRCYFPLFTCLLSGKTFPCVAFVEIFQISSFCTLAEDDQSRYLSGLRWWRGQGPRSPDTLPELDYCMCNLWVSSSTISCSQTCNGTKNKWDHVLRK